MNTFQEYIAEHEKSDETTIGEETGNDDQSKLALRDNKSEQSKAEDFAIAQFKSSK